MVKGKATIKNNEGIHCRPTALIIQAAANYPGAITVTGEHGHTTLHSALEIMMLGLGKGAKITIQVDGPDEKDTLKKFIDLFEYRFDFKPLD